MKGSAVRVRASAWEEALLARCAVPALGQRAIRRVSQPRRWSRLSALTRSRPGPQLTLSRLESRELMTSRPDPPARSIAEPFSPGHGPTP